MSEPKIRLGQISPSASGDTINGNVAVSGTFTVSNNLIFSGTGLRILGDMSNATQSNRLAFQTSTTNGATDIYAIPNGTNSTGAFTAVNASDPNNASTAILGAFSDSVRLYSNRNGTGTFYPMTFYTGGSERMRLDTSGNLGIGTASPLSRLHVESDSNIRAVIRNSTENTSFSSSWDFMTGTGSFASTNIVGRVVGLITQADPSALQSALAFHTNSGDSVGERMRITATGNVGIGTTTADSRLHVAGSFRQTFATVPFEWTVNAGAVDFYKLNAVGYADNLIVLNGAGRVGFGTNNPSTAGRVTVANNMGMVIAHETAGVDIRVGFGNLTGNSNSYYGTVLGYRALNNCTAVSYSVAIGYDALQACTTGQENTAVGYYSLKQLTTGRDNVGFGSYTGQGLTTGNYNVAIGRAALNTANTGDYNTAVGYLALYYTTTGYQNSAYGPFSLYNNTTGYYNSAYGVNTLRNNTTGYTNDSFGIGALYNNTTGIENKAFGYQALFYNTTGSYNIAIGSNALVYNQTSSYNTMVGNFAGYGVTANSTSYYNTALGYATLYSMRSATANYNTAIAAYALQNLTTGYENVALGYYSGFGVTTGIQNTLIGQQAGYYLTALTTGTYNICLGAYTRTGSATATYQIVIGYDIAGVGDNYVTIGKAGGYIYNKYDTNATWTQTSDERLKKNIQTDNLGLSFINRLRPVTYNWKASNELDPTNPLYKTENDRDTATVMHGLIAQEVKAAMVAEGCDTFGGWDEKNGIQSISREQFISPLINAVKELSAKIALLETEIKTLKGE